MTSIKEIFRSYGVLDAQGRHVNGTDKETNHRYGDAYERLFSSPDHEANLCLHDPDWSHMRFCSECRSDTSHFQQCSQFKWRSLRDDIKLMMEVGIADGSSLLAWRDILPNATCVGLDIHHSERASGERIEFHLGDASSYRDCDRAAMGRQFDFICEDASHQMCDSLATMFFLWPHVRPGGLYVIEEFYNVGEWRNNILALWPHAEIVDTVGPSGNTESLTVFRKAVR